MATNKTFWIIWLAISLLAVIYFTVQLSSEDKTLFLPGKATHGHYQIEMSCSSCHAEPFGGTQVLQDACINCHAAELKAARDSHPKSKFTDPRNADRVRQLDARLCVTCHTEHKTEITHKAGLTLPEDYCFKCHADIADDRPSHKGMDFKTCATGGCHNYHDNRGLYEDFIAKHLNEPRILSSAFVQHKSSAEELTLVNAYPLEKYPVMELNETQGDYPASLMESSAHKKVDWLSTSHSRVGVNCSACHEQKQAGGVMKWTNTPDHNSCKNCHKDETSGFLNGKHGMRLKAGLTPMQPDMARLTMKKTSHGKQLSCVSCHGAHDFDVRHAAVESCLNCHDDSHSNNYKASKHFQAWHLEINGKSAPGAGVSCATCHLPRIENKHGEINLVLTEHNQNANLRPNEKMLRDVCMKCHGLGFSIDALADEALVKNNFQGDASQHIESLDMVERRLSDKKKKKEGGL